MNGQHVTVRQAIERLRQFDRKGLYEIARRAFYRALAVGRREALAELRRTDIGKMVQRRGNVLLELGTRSRSKRWKSDQSLASLRESTIPLIVRRSEMTTGHAGLGLRAGLEASGFAALIATGGRTKSHQIKRIRLGGYSRGRTTRAKQVAAQPPLTFQVGNRWVSPRIVTHPGSRVPRNPFLEHGAHAAAGALPEAFETELGRGLKDAL